MPKETRALLAFNRGIMSRMGLARADLPRTALSAEQMTNWQPRALGSMMLRPGWQYLSSTNGNAKARHIPFVFAFDDTALLELVEDEMQVRIDDQLITRPTVTAAIANGTFDSNLTSWTDNDEAGAASTWLTGGYMALLGDGTNAARRDQQVTVNQANTEHALRIIIARGPVILRVGSTSGGDEYISETTLGTGTHSLAFTPTGSSFYIRLMNRRSFTTLVDSVAVESAGVMQLPTPWDEEDLALIRKTQSGDVIYAACTGYQQRKIERRATRSWSVVKYEPETGPFRNVNVTPITMAPSALSGDITITASQAYFKSTNVDSLIRIQSSGQTVTASISAENTFTNPIRVSGVEGQRAFGISISGTFVATLTLQYSVGEPGNWVDVQTYTATTSVSYNDNLDNQVIYYRIGVKTGAYTSGTAVATLSFTSGSIVGIARITAYTSPTQVSAVVLADFGATTGSSDWWEGRWSDRRGWPSAVCLHESRMGMFGRDNIDLSISDQYEDFDDEFEGDAGPISRSIGEGPIETIPWALSLTRLIVGTLSSSANIEALKIQGNNPLSGRSSSLDEPLTPTNFNLKTVSPTGMFVDTSLTRLMELKFDINENDYVPEDLCVAVPDLNEEEIAGIAVQYKPDMRVWCWRTDGTVGVMLRDRAENLTCWFEFETDGDVEDVCVLPGAVEDRVYLIVKRTINGSTVRYVEKAALESECRGGTQNKQADSFLTGTNSPASTTISGLTHLVGESVVVWADGVNYSPITNGTQTTFTVSSSGTITLGTAVTDWVVGLPYEARWKSGKQAFAAALGTALNVKGFIDHIGFVLLDTHCRGLRFGPNFTTLDPLPMVVDEEEIDEDTVHEEFDKARMSFPGTWDTDPRVCLVANAPMPCTVAAVSIPLVKSG
jgi:hypothetical protein